MPVFVEMMLANLLVGHRKLEDQALLFLQLRQDVNGDKVGGLLDQPDGHCSSAPKLFFGVPDHRRRVDDVPFEAVLDDEVVDVAADVASRRNEMLKVKR